MSGQPSTSTCRCGSATTLGDTSGDDSRCPPLPRREAQAGTWESWTPSAQGGDDSCLDSVGMSHVEATSHIHMKVLAVSHAIHSILNARIGAGSTQLLQRCDPVGFRFEVRRSCSREREDAGPRVGILPAEPLHIPWRSSMEMRC